MNLTKRLPDYDKEMKWEAISSAYPKMPDAQKLKLCEQILTLQKWLRANGEEITWKEARDILGACAMEEAEMRR